MMIQKIKMSLLIMLCLMSVMVLASCGDKNPTTGTNDNTIGTGAVGDTGARNGMENNAGTNSGTSTTGNGTATDYKNNNTAGGVVDDAARDVARGVDDAARGAADAVEDFFDSDAKPGAGNTTAK